MNFKFILPACALAVASTPARAAIVPIAPFVGDQREPLNIPGSSIVADMVVEVMVGGKNPKAEADRAQKRAEELLTQLGHKRWS